MTTELILYLVSVTGMTFICCMVLAYHQHKTIEKLIDRNDLQIEQEMEVQRINREKELTSFNLQNTMKDLDNIRVQHDDTLREFKATNESLKKAHSIIKDLEDQMESEKRSAFEKGQQQGIDRTTVAIAEIEDELTRKHAEEVLRMQASIDEYWLQIRTLMRHAQTVDDFNIRDLVVYFESGAEGVVSSKNDTYVFVQFGNNAAGQACKPFQLSKVVHASQPTC